MAQRVWPDYTTLQNPETAFMDVARVASGPLLFAAYGVMLLISSHCLRACGTRGRLALALQHGTRRRVAEKNLRASEPEKSNPIYNVWIIGVLAYIGVITIPWELAAEVVTFGALLAFMGVNLAALRHFWFSPEAVGTPQLLRRCLRASVGIRFLFWLAVQPANLDEIRGSQLAGDGNCSTELIRRADLPCVRS